MDIQKCIIVVTACAVVGCAAKLGIDWMKSDNKNKKNEEDITSTMTEQIDSGISQSTFEDTQSAISGMSLMESITLDFFKQQGVVSETNEHTESSESTAASRFSSRKRRNKHVDSNNSDSRYHSENRGTTATESRVEPQPTETQATTLPTEQSHAEVEPTEEEFSVEK